MDGYIFTNLSSLSSISIEEAIKYHEEGKEIIFGGMFYDSFTLTSLPDISKWNTNKVTDMSDMFGSYKEDLNIPS